MNFTTDDQISSSSSDIDVCSSSPNCSPKLFHTKTVSTPISNYKPRVNFHSVESLAVSSLNTSSGTPDSSPFSVQKHDDTGYDSLNASKLTFDADHKENSLCALPLTTIAATERKSRRKLTDWQVWHLREAYEKSRYPSSYEQEQLAAKLVLPLSCIRIWFQNHRARSVKK